MYTLTQTIQLKKAVLFECVIMELKKRTVEIIYRVIQRYTEVDPRRRHRASISCLRGHHECNIPIINYSVHIQVYSPHIRDQSDAISKTLLGMKIGRRQTL